LSVGLLLQLPLLLTLNLSDPHLLKALAVDSWLVNFSSNNHLEVGLEILKLDSFLSHGGFGVRLKPDKLLDQFSDT